MSQELGKIEKPLTEQFKGARKLFFVPLLYSGKEPPAEYLDKLKKYWEQVEKQLTELELKLGQIGRIYHELIAAAGEEGIEAIKDLNDNSYQIVRSRIENGAQLEATENIEILTEFMDWTRCLAIGLQNQNVFTKVYEFYTAASKKRSEFITRHIDETLQPNQIGIIFMREGHHVQFVSDIEVFYVSPPALNEINHWLRDQEAQPHQKVEGESGKKEGD